MASASCGGHFYCLGSWPFRAAQSSASLQNALPPRAALVPGPGDPGSIQFSGARVPARLYPCRRTRPKARASITQMDDWKYLARPSAAGQRAGNQHALRQRALTQPTPASQPENWPASTARRSSESVRRSSCAPWPGRAASRNTHSSAAARGSPARTAESSAAPADR